MGILTMKALEEYISNIANQTRQSDAVELLSILEQASGYKPRLIGSIIGFGTYHYKYESGLEGDGSVIAFSPRKQNMVVYIMPGFSKYQHLLEKLGKYKLGKSCLYLNKLKDIDTEVFRQIAELSVEEMQEKYECKNA